jgi:hypothetical protein
MDALATLFPISSSFREWPLVSVPSFTETTRGSLFPATIYKQTRQRRPSNWCKPMSAHGGTSATWQAIKTIATFILEAAIGAPATHGVIPAP